MAFNLLAMLVLVVEAGRRLEGVRAAFWSGFFFLTASLLTVGSLEVRPDTVQVTLGFIAVVLMLPGPHRLSHGIRWGMAGLLTGLAFCTLQKQVLFLVSVTPFFVRVAQGGPQESDVTHERTSMSHLAVFGVLAALPVALLLLPYLREGTLDRYLLYCWKFNASYALSRQLDPLVFSQSTRYAPHFWALALAGLLVPSGSPAQQLAIKVPALLGLLLTISTGAQYKQYLFGVWPFLALAAGLGHVKWVRALGKRGQTPRVGYWALFLTVLAVGPVSFLSMLPPERANFEQLAACIRFVERNVPAGERFFDDDHRLNLRRFDLGFNWFGRSTDFADLSSAAKRNLQPDRVAEALRWRPRLVALTLPYDARTRQFFEKRYVPTSYRKVLAAGATAAANEHGVADFEIWLAGKYEILSYEPLEKPHLEGLDRIWAPGGELLAPGTVSVAGLPPRQRVHLRVCLEPP
ncbi:MAG: hypothetical protein HYY25_13045 [Candidatus Wallbacteria bacterium]|nr:hypothetical protein [Candidatus Wallbacteria bacterium]